MFKTPQNSSVNCPRLDIVDVRIFLQTVISQAFQIFPNCISETIRKLHITIICKFCHIVFASHNDQITELTLSGRVLNFLPRRRSSSKRIFELKKLRIFINGTDLYIRYVKLWDIDSSICSTGHSWSQLGPVVNLHSITGRLAPHPLPRRVRRVSTQAIWNLAHRIYIHETPGAWKSAWFHLSFPTPVERQLRITCRWAGGRWTWRTAPAWCCRIPSTWCSTCVRTTSCIPQSPSTLKQSQCIRTWAASTWSSSDHRSIRASCFPHGTQLLAVEQTMKTAPVKTRPPRWSRLQNLFIHFGAVLTDTKKMLKWRTSITKNLRCRTQCREPSQTWWRSQSAWPEHPGSGRASRRGSRTSGCCMAPTPARKSHHMYQVLNTDIAGQ